MLGEAQLAQPQIVGIGPGPSAGVDDAPAQQQLREPVPGTHQVAAGVLPGADQVACGFLVQARDRHRRDLVHPQQASQVKRIAGIGLDPIAGRTLQLRWRHHLAPDTRRGE
jgi:hypothetical protein